MVKVWNINRAGDENDQTKEKQESQNQSEPRQRPRLGGIQNQDLQTNLVISNNQNSESKGKKRQNSNFDFKAVIDEELSLNITENILSRSIIRSIKQVTIVVKSIPPEPNKLNRILLLGGEKGKMYSLGLNFSLSKVSQIGNETQSVDEFYISKQNQIFCILNSYEVSQILQIGHDSSSQVDVVQRNIDSFHVNFEEEQNLMKFYYGNGNKLVMIKTKIPEKKIKLSDEELLEIELQQIQNELIVKAAEQEKKSQQDEKVQDKAEDSINEKENNQNKEDSNQDAKENEKAKEKEKSDGDPSSEYKTCLDFTQPYKMDFSKDEKLFSKDLENFRDKIHRILEIKIKNKQVLFALVMNKNQNITQDCYLFNFECKSGNADSSRSRNFNDRSRSRSNLNFRQDDQNERNFRGNNRQFNQIQKDLRSNESQDNRREQRDNKNQDGVPFQRNDRGQNNDNSSNDRQNSNRPRNDRFQRRDQQQQQGDRNNRGENPNEDSKGYSRDRNQRGNRNVRNARGNSFNRNPRGNNNFGNSRGDNNDRNQRRDNDSRSQRGDNGERNSYRFNKNNQGDNRPPSRFKPREQGNNSNQSRNRSFGNNQGRNNSRATGSNWNKEKISQ